MKSSPLLLRSAAMILALGDVGSAAAQEHVPTAMASRSDLREALNGPVGNIYSLSLAYIAAQPEVTSRDLVGLGREQSLPYNIRANALRTLAFLPDEEAAGALLALAESPGRMQRVAWATLQTFTQDRMCASRNAAHWRGPGSKQLHPAPSSGTTGD